RSSTYCTDVAKMIQAPIFHVNAEDPEAAVYVALLALDFRQTFHDDVVIDLVCYRRHGHNETDEPSFTQPVMYRKIRERPSLKEVYTEQLIMHSVLTTEEALAIDDEFKAKLQQAQKEVKSGPRRRAAISFSKRWSGFSNRYSHAVVETGVPFETLQTIAEALTHVPEGFALHPKMAKHLEGVRE